jgi:hypothetical protein
MRDPSPVAGFAVPPGRGFAAAQNARFITRFPYVGQVARRRKQRLVWPGGAEKESGIYVLTPPGLGSVPGGTPCRLGHAPSVSPAMNSSPTCRLDAAPYDRCFVMAPIQRKQQRGVNSNRLICSPQGAHSTVRTSRLIRLSEKELQPSPLVVRMSEWVTGTMNGSLTQLRFSSSCRLPGARAVQRYETARRLRQDQLA